MGDEALAIVQKVLESKRLNYVQETVLLQTWSGKNYREIAHESGYALDYVREVGSQLWSSLSRALGEKVTKKNVKLILMNSHSIKSGKNRINIQLEPRIPEALKFPNGAMPLSSNMYIERPPIEERVYTEISRPGSVIHIKASQQMGKTSLVYRILANASCKGLRTVYLNLQQADSQVFTNLDLFLRWFCLNVSRQLKLEPKLNEYWDEESGSKVSCTVYFQEYLLEHLESPLVLALDEVSCIFEYPDLAQDFLSLLRTWHEETVKQEVWQKLRLVVVNTTEVYGSLKINQPPFNVGLPIQLPEFSLEQVQDLAQRHGLDSLGLRTQHLELLLNMVGGHPYLLRLAFYWLKQQEMILEQLLQEAPTQAGIYGAYLLRHWEVLQKHPELGTAFRKVVTSPGSVQLEAITAYHLQSMGLVTLNGNQATPRCELYRLYFSSQFKAVETKESDLELSQ